MEALLASQSSWCQLLPLLFSLSLSLSLFTFGYRA